MVWISENIQYDGDHDSKVYGREFWQTPEETAILKRGDCEDLSLLFLEICQRNGIYGIFIMVDSTIPGFLHVVVLIENQIFDPSLCLMYSVTVMNDVSIYKVLTYANALDLLWEKR